MRGPQIFLSPGPTTVPVRVAHAEGRPMVSHRSSDFSAVFRQMTEGVQAVFRTKNDLLTLTASGTGGMEAVAADAAEKSSFLLGLGINVNFAPVCDVSTDSGDFIYDRAFGQDAAATSDYAETVTAAMDAAGIGAVMKHFPGYGDNVDTHTGIAVDQRPYETFETSDFLPFAAGMTSPTAAVLVSHNIVVSMDETLPASLSPEVHRVLREELGFTGVAMTDDLAMDALAQYSADGSAAVLAVQAGNDMIVTTDYESQIPAVIAAVEDGRISEERLDEAVTRVLAWKIRLGLIAPEGEP